MTDVVKQCIHYIVPSGHILTKLELQVLATLLNKYSDENLEQIKLSIQKKEGTNILREDIEKSLRTGGLTSIADDLKDSLEKGKTDQLKAIFSFFDLETIICINTIGSYHHT